MRHGTAASLVLASVGVACSTAAPSRPRAPLEAEPRFAAETLTGEAVKIGGPGPVRLVEVWATWCAPCAAASERARAVLRRHPQVLAYAVSIDADRDAVARHVAATPPAGEPLLFGGGPAAAARRGLGDVPTFIVLDTRGRVVGRMTGLSGGLGPTLERLLRRAEGRE